MSLADRKTTQAMESITRLSNIVIRVLGQNPGKFTLQGTNTYIIGSCNPFILIDTGEGKPEYISVLRQVLTKTVSPSNPKEPDISDIVISHWHTDHFGGLISVLALLKNLWEDRNPVGTAFKPPRLHKFPLFTDSATPPEVISSLLPDSFMPSPDGAPFHDLHDNQILSSLHVIHCPGHTPDSISLYIPEDRALCTADTVLGQGTSVFEDLAKYMSSLQKLLDFPKTSGKDYTQLYPGHGPVVSNAVEHIEGYIKHRQERGAQILQVLETKGGTATIWAIVAIIYAVYPESLWSAAAHSTELHLKKLEGEGRVERVGVVPSGKDSEWQLIR